MQLIKWDVSSYDAVNQINPEWRRNKCVYSIAVSACTQREFSFVANTPVTLACYCLVWLFELYSTPEIGSEIKTKQTQPNILKSLFRCMVLFLLMCFLNCLLLVCNLPALWKRIAFSRDVCINEHYSFATRARQACPTERTSLWQFEKRRMESFLDFQNNTQGGSNLQGVHHWAMSNLRVKLWLKFCAASTDGTLPCILPNRPRPSQNTNIMNSKTCG